MSNALIRAVSVAVACLCQATAQAAINLPAYNVDTSQTTVSGLSSGGFMANQLGTAYSATFKGVGVFAAGPYLCAGYANYTNCMYNASISTTVLNQAQNAINTWSGNQIDNKANIATQKVFMFVGNSDTTVGPNPMNMLQTQYNNNGVSGANLDYIQLNNVSHVFPTDFDSTGNNACNSATSPFISNCSYDGAKAVLTKFYGTLNARNNAPAAGNYIEFNQTEFVNNPGMSATGWVYVPANCAAGSQCKVHVALHGCKQTHEMIGDKYIKNTGYTRWADTNSIIVLFPQTKVDNTSRQTMASGSLSNPNACWDWLGWYGNNFGQKTGPQMAAIKAMVDRLSSGNGSGNGGGSGGGGTPTPLPAPTNITASNATSSSMLIGWSAVAGASGYNVYRGATKANSLTVNGTTYTDTSLTASTAYSWTVKAVDANGAEGTASSAVTASTSAAQAATCYTASNYAHTTAGRATQSLGTTYAKGSNQNMGLWNTFTVTTLKMTAPNYYVIGSCN